MSGGAPTSVAIYGSGGLGRVVRDILLAAGRLRVVAFLDSDHRKQGAVVDGLEVQAGREAIGRVLGGRSVGVVVAIGQNSVRVAVAERLRREGVPLVSAIHPLASIAPSARLAEHVIVGARATVCVHASIGPHCVLATGAIVDHDNSLGKGVFLQPAVRLAGGVTVEDYALLGIGACVIPYRRVGRRAFVDAGAVVIRDVEPETAVGGVPAVRRWGLRSRFVAGLPGGWPEVVAVRESGSLGTEPAESAG